MDLKAFRDSLSAELPPPGLSPALEALWYQGRNQWTAAHDRLQEDNSSAGAWVHAHLHRVEGDDSNAAYWYRRAGQPVASGPVDAEWEAVAEALLSQT